MLRRLARNVFTICSAVSLLLCLAVCALWIDSQWTMRDVIWTSDPHYPWSGGGGDHRSPSFIRVESEQTHLRIVWLFRDPDRHLRVVNYDTWPPRETTALNDWWPDSSDVRADVLGASLLIRHAPGYPFRGVLIPYWMMALALALLPALRIAGWRRSRRLRSRLRRGHCPACGYDLRASPARCPECGTPAK